MVGTGDSATQEQKELVYKIVMWEYVRPHDTPAYSTRNGNLCRLYESLLDKQGEAAGNMKLAGFRNDNQVDAMLADLCTQGEIYDSAYTVIDNISRDIYDFAFIKARGIYKNILNYDISFSELGKLCGFMSEAVFNKKVVVLVETTDEQITVGMATLDIRDSQFNNYTTHTVFDMVPKVYKTLCVRKDGLLRHLEEENICK